MYLLTERIKKMRKTNYAYNLLSDSLIFLLNVTFIIVLERIYLVKCFRNFIKENTGIFQDTFLIRTW